MLSKGPSSRPPASKSRLQNAHARLSRFSSTASSGCSCGRARLGLLARAAAAACITRNESLRRRSENLEQRIRSVCSGGACCGFTAASLAASLAALRGEARLLGPGRGSESASLASGTRGLLAGTAMITTSSSTRCTCSPSQYLSSARGARYRPEQTQRGVGSGGHKHAHDSGRRHSGRCGREGQSIANRKNAQRRATALRCRASAQSIVAAAEGANARTRARCVRPSKSPQALRVGSLAWQPAGTNPRRTKWLGGGGGALEWRQQSAASRRPRDRQRHRCDRGRWDGHG